MALRKKPRCFVAMAFGHDDTDRLYDCAIRPVLRRNGVIPVRIDRRQKNHDLNEQIIEQLNACDFCIADVTYARQSVYFEAGYAQRRVEVIYTVRTDHLGRNQPDERRVHFDLQMKPLIKWEKADDPTFPKRLESRLRSTVLKEFRRRARDDDRLREEMERFSAMPLTERLGLLGASALNAFRRIGFGEWTLYSVEHSAGWRMLDSLGKQFNQQSKPFLNGRWGFTGLRRRKTIAEHATVFPLESAHLSRLREIGEAFVTKDDLPFSQVDLEHMRRFRDYVLVLALKHVPHDRIMSAIPCLTLKRDWGCYVSDRRMRTERRYPRPDRTVPREVRVCFVSGIESKRQLREQLAKVMSTISS